MHFVVRRVTLDRLALEATIEFQLDSQRAPCPFRQVRCRGDDASALKGEQRPKAFLGVIVHVKPIEGIGYFGKVRETTCVPPLHGFGRYVTPLNDRALLYAHDISIGSVECDVRHRNAITQRFRVGNEPSLGISRKSRFDRERFIASESDFALHERLTPRGGRGSIGVERIHCDGDFVGIDDPGNREADCESAVANVAHEGTFSGAIRASHEVEVRHSAL